jgi:hypothetical protein
MGFEVELHNTYFVHDEDDDKWIPDVAARKWVILSGDKQLCVEPLNKEAVKESKAQVLLVTDTNSIPEQWPLRSSWADFGFRNFWASIRGRYSSRSEDKPRITLTSPKSTFLTKKRLVGLNRSYLSRPM